MNSLSSAHSKEVKSKQAFHYGNKNIEYTLIQSKRRKTCEVIVDKDGVTIRAPFNKSIIEIEHILNNKIKWISLKQKEIQRKEPEP
jgi:predicted metal-dependent hydrolase